MTATRREGRKNHSNCTHRPNSFNRAITCRLVRASARRGVFVSLGCHTPQQIPTIRHQIFGQAHRAQTYSGENHVFFFFMSHRRHPGCNRCGLASFSSSKNATRFLKSPSPRLSFDEQACHEVRLHASASPQRCELRRRDQECGKLTPSLFWTRGRQQHSPSRSPRFLHCADSPAQCFLDKAK